jgi:allantoin racemase
MHAATLLGRGFSVVTTLSRTVGRAWDLAHRYGFAAACRGVHACDIPVLDLEDPTARKTVTELCVAAVERDGSDAVVLGCAGMADFAAEVSEETGVPVIDGVTAATKLVESLVTLGLRTGKRGEYALPRPKRYSGLLRDFTI